MIDLGVNVTFVLALMRRLFTTIPISPRIYCAKCALKSDDPKLQCYSATLLQLAQDPRIPLSVSELEGTISACLPNVQTQFHLGLRHHNAQ